MPRVLIIADDLSGAADCDIACVHAGNTATVSLSNPLIEVEADVLALDADTRVLESAAPPTVYTILPASTRPTRP